MEDVRERCDHLTTIWLRLDLKKALYVHCETNEGFKHYHLRNRANRVSAKSSKYIGGSATFIKTKVRLYKSLSRDATIAETFKYTHTLKENKERFADQQAAHHYESKHHRCETASKSYKKHVYGLGSFFADDLCTSTLRHSFASATSHPIDLEDGVNLREKVLELTSSLHQ
ncbi:hypothetical protein Ahy_A07g031618 [Arachis hypogaea]|uniref:Uncharacterized protein n=1 Tax=Arachis hypogaea TaxID=3818 RepID=A0A445C4J4_ARAHY|nr:hypothetical protein Ahy_A07g031618 [Arachis hypogaea]